MEDVLDLYAEPHDPRRPVVCFDERPVPLVGETRTPIPTAPGRPRRFDYEYRRNGVVNLFTVLEPHTGWRHVEATLRRTRVDFAEQMKALVDQDFADAQVVRVVLDNLNVHSVASLYVAFPPAEARRIAKKLAFHFTPKHGSWLNTAECELSVLSRQCLSRRLPDLETLQDEVWAWEERRNQQQATAHGHFTTTQARKQLRRLYLSPAASA